MPRALALGPPEKFLNPIPTDKDRTSESLERDGSPSSTQATARFSDRLFQHRAVEVLRYRDFRLLWFGHVFGSMAFWMDQVVGSEPSYRSALTLHGFSISNVQIALGDRV